MDFCSLFDPSDGNQSKPTKKLKNNQDNVKKKNDGQKGRRGRKSSKNESLPEESSFLCEPALEPQLVITDESYIDSYIKRDESPCSSSSRSRRRGSRRPRRRRSKTSPRNSEGGDQGEPLWNNRQSVGRPPEPLGRNVNDVSSMSVPLLMEQLQEVSLNDLRDDGEGEGGSDGGEEDPTGDSSPGRLPPEPRFGNVEYKLQLVAPGEKRFQHLVTQLKWRLASGGGNAIYLIGVRDCGQLRGLSPSALRASLATLRLMARALGARIAHVCVRKVASNSGVAEVYIKRLVESQQSVELRVAVMGANDAGKSTLIGVLTQGELDNGCGSARLNMFRHLHEVRSGMTSSLSQEILGFDAQGNVVNYGCSELMTAERIGERSAKLVCFLDVAGHRRYQRTTLTGLSGYCPHVAMLLISSRGGMSRMTVEHLTLLLAMRVPLFVVVTKCDLRGDVTPLLDALDDRLAAYRMKSMLISDEKALSRLLVAPQKLILDLVDEDSNDHQEDNDGSWRSRVPVFCVSSVRGTGLSYLHAYLLALHPPEPRHDDTLHEACEFQIDEVFHADAGGGVVGGLLVAGELREGDELLVGPLACGAFTSGRVVSLRVHGRGCARAGAGHSASLRLRTTAPLRPGMTLLSKKQPPESQKDESIPQNRKPTRRKDTNLLQDINNAETILAKDKVDAVNIYNSDSDSDKSSGGEETRQVDSDSDKSNDGGGKRRVDSDKCDVDVSDELVAEDPYNPRGCMYFQAWVEVIQHATEIAAGFQFTVHANNVRQTAVIQGIMSATGTLRAGSRASVLLRFVRAPEYLPRGRRLLLSAGQGSKAIGRVTQVFPYVPDTT